MFHIRLANVFFGRYKEIKTNQIYNITKGNTPKTYKETLSITSEKHHESISLSQPHDEVITSIEKRKQIHINSYM